MLLLLIHYSKFLDWIMKITYLSYNPLIDLLSLIVFFASSVNLCTDIIDKLSDKILQKKSVDSASDDEERKWRQ